MYAGNILYTASLFFAKCSILISVRAITPVRRHRYAIDALSSLVAVWFISSEFALAFECDTPRPWDIVKSGCHNKVCAGRCRAPTQINLTIALACDISLRWNYEHNN